MPRLHDYILSAECYTARLMMALLGVTYEVHALEMYPGKETDTPAFRALSPAGRVPVLENGEQVVAGAAEVLMHLASAYDPDGRWLPANGRGLVVSWLQFATSELAVLEQARQAALFGRGEVEGLRRQGWLALRTLEDRMIERGMDGAEWIVRSNPSIADIAAFPHVALSHDCGIGLEDFPALNLWQRRVRRLPRFISMPGIPDFF